MAWIYKGKGSFISIAAGDALVSVIACFSWLIKIKKGGRKYPAFSFF